MQVPSQSSSNNGPVVLVDGLVVQPAYRSTPWDAERKYGSADRDKVCVQIEQAVVLASKLTKLTQLPTLLPAD